MTLSDMAIFDDVRYPSLSASLNYIFAVQLPLIFLLSLLLNPLVFVYNHKRKRGIAATLFQLQAVFDFLTNLYQPIILSAALVSDFSGWRWVGLTALHGPLIQTASLVTTVMPITRCIKITSPFYQIRRGLIVCYCVAVPTGLAVGYTLALATAPSLRFDPYIQLVVWDTGDAPDLWMACLTLPYILHTLAALLATMVTVRCLSRKAGTSLHRRGVVTVLIMNVGNFTLFTSTIFYLCMKLSDGHSLLYRVSKFLSLSYLPFLISALNPLVVATRSRGFWAPRRGASESVTRVAPTVPQAMRGVVVLATLTNLPSGVPRV